MKISCLLFLLAALGSSANADVRLPKIFTSHAVLQRDQPIHLWGWSEPGERVTVSLNGATQNATGDRLGRWSVYLPPEKAGGPYQLTVSGTNRVVLDDILIGDVWFASGQSNMEMPLNGFPGSAVVNNAAEEIRSANHPDIRLLLIPRKGSLFPLADFEGDAKWTLCTPETAAKFSAVAYFFGRAIAEREHVPIGLIDSTWGGTPAEAWISMDSIGRDASLMPIFASWAKLANEQADLPAEKAAEQRDKEEARRAGRPLPEPQWHPDAESFDPSWLFNGMVAPATGFRIKGVIWYQGETNSALDRAPIYERVFSDLIRDWRRHWEEGDFPFLFVQISSYKSEADEMWPVAREAQRRTLALINTAMAVTIDIGDPVNIHPADKQSAGARLALAARAIAYGEAIEYSGPLFREASVEDSSMRVWFTHAREGLIAKGGALEGFEVAGEDRRFVKANARIDGSTVVAGNPEISKPKFIRYGWQSAPQVNLFNSAGLPASPFTSEQDYSQPGASE